MTNKPDLKAPISKYSVDSDHAVPEYALAVAEMLDAYAFRIRQGKSVQELGRDIRHLGVILERRT